jgi:hypothetical protein
MNGERSASELHAEFDTSCDCECETQLLWLCDCSVN